MQLCLRIAFWSMAFMPGTGVHIDVAQEALKRLSCEVRLLELPWARATLELERGRLDLLAGAANTKERESFALRCAEVPATAMSTMP